MASRTTTLIHGDLTDKIIGIYHQAHYELGSGFLEKVCQRAMVIALVEAGLSVREEVPLRVHFRGRVIGCFFADLVVNDLALVEVKSCPALNGRHKAQVLNYLRASWLEVGLIVNFGPTREINRVVLSNARKGHGPAAPDP
jgi:GxxExxY protein